MLKALKVTGQSEIYNKVQKLYIKSFPENQRNPLEFLLNGYSNYGEILAFYENEIFCGFISILTYCDITHILYFAIEETMRGKGYGSRVLEIIREMKAGNRIIADLELVTDKASNNEQRRNRKGFYINNGYVESGVCYVWRDESYEILINGGEISEKEFEEFWDVIDSIRKVLIGLK